MITELAGIYRTVFNVPSIELRREVLLELVNIRLDAGRIRVVVRRIDRVLVAQRREATEVAVLLCQLEGLACESIPPCDTAP